MKLFLASEAKHPESIEKLRRFIGGSFKGKTIAYIPTAANGEEPFGSWKQNSSTWKVVNTLGAKVTSVQLEDYKNSSVIAKLKNKDIQVNAISPSDTATEAYKKYFPQYTGDAIDPIEIAKYAVYLCSAEASSITGKVFVMKKGKKPYEGYHT